MCYSFWIHFCSIFLHLFPILTFFFSLILWFQLVHPHFTISNVIPTGLKILREEHIEHLKYQENSSRFCLCCCVNYSSIDFVKIAGFGCRLNYQSFNGRFHLLEKDMAESSSSSLFDIIITFIVVVSHHHLHWHQQDKHRNQCNRCQSFILPSTHDCALSDAQSWVNWRKIVLASVELSRLLHMIFESLTAGQTRRDTWNLLDLYKIDLKNKIFSSLKGCLFPSNWQPITYFALLS